MNYKVIASGSQGNCVIYHSAIAVDMGVPFSLIKPFLFDLQIVLLTHEHLDHFNINTLLNLSQNRPALRFGCCQWMTDKLKGIRNVDVYEIGKLYDYGSFQISPIKLYHDAPNCGYRIFKDNYKILHATDTAHLEGITAKDYDLFALEHNFDEETVFAGIERHRENGQFDYRQFSVNGHLSEQQARQFIFNNKGSNYEVLRLHESKNI